MTQEITGVIPAVFVPIDETDAIHREGYREHVAELSAHPGIDGILCNGHAGESYALSGAERVELVEIATEAVAETGTDTPVYSGVVGATTDAVIEDARRLQRAGAEAVMVDPPATPIHGRPAAAVAFYREVVASVDVPVVAFQTAARTGRDFSPAVLAEIASIDGVAAVKEGVWEYDRSKADLQALRERDVAVLMGNDEHLFPCYALGVDGTVVELAAAVPDLIVALYEAVQRGDLERAREIDRRMEPLLEVIYQEPKHDGSIRLKALLERQGRLPSARPRRPALPLPDEEVAAIERVIEEVGL